MLLSWDFILVMSRTYQTFWSISFLLPVQKRWPDRFSSFGPAGVSNFNSTLSRKLWWTLRLHLHYVLYQKFGIPCFHYPVFRPGAICGLIKTRISSPFIFEWPPPDSLLQIHLPIVPVSSSVHQCLHLSSPFPFPWWCFPSTLLKLPLLFPVSPLIIPFLFSQVSSCLNLSDPKNVWAFLLKKYLKLHKMSFYISKLIQSRAPNFVWFSSLLMFAKNLCERGLTICYGS